MVTTKHCSYGDCNSDSRYYHKEYMNNVTFYRFPDKQKYREKCKRWVKACGREGFTISNVSRFMHICSKHFHGGTGPTNDYPDPISAIASDSQKRKFLNPRRKLVRQFPSTENDLNQPFDTNDMDSNHESNGGSELHAYNNIKTYGKSARSAILHSQHQCSARTSLNDLLSLHHEAHVEDWFATPKKREGLSISLSAQVVADEIDLATLFTIMQEGWFVGRDSNSIMFTLFDEGVISKFVTLDIGSGLFTFEAFGNKTELSQLNNIPDFLSKSSEILEVLTVIKDLKICEEAKPKLAHASKKQLCSVVIAKKATRCTNCTKNFRSVAQHLRRKKRSLSRIQDGIAVKKPRLNFRVMTKQDLTSVVRLQRYKFSLERQKFNRAVARFQRKLDSGHLLTNNDSEVFSDIVQHNVPHIENNPLLKQMLLEQIKAAKTSKYGMRWHPEIIKWAAYLQQKSAAAYDTINSSGFFRLPSISTLRRHSVDFKHDSGFHTHVLEDMRKQADIDNVPCHQKYVALVMDEMNIRSNIVYNKFTGELVGFSKLSESAVTSEGLEAKLNSDEVPNVATNMLALFVRGLTSTFKYSFAHFPTSKLTGNGLLSVVWNAIQLLENAGFRVLVIIADGAAPNRNFFKLSAYGVHLPHKVENIYAVDEPRPVYFICDVPHLLKTTRNCLLHSTVMCKPRRMRINNHELLWSHVQEIYYKSLQTNYRIAWRLTDNHVFLTPRSLMKVRLAAQVLSSRTAAAMELLVGAKAAETVRFIRMFNDWFDCLNVANTFRGIQQRNKNLMPYKSPNDDRLKWLKETFVGYLESWKEEINNLEQFKPDEKKRMFLSNETYEGHVITVNAITEVIPFLLRKGADYVLTSHFQQDILEQEFSKQRHRGGGNENPNVEQFGWNAKKLNAARAYVADKRNGNTIEQK